MPILVLNSGSSSIKFSLFDRNRGQLTKITSGIADAIGLKNAELRINAGAKNIISKGTIPTHRQALKNIFEQLKTLKLLESPKSLELISHRLVHGGEQYSHPTKITPTVLRNLKKLIPLAPLHNPGNISGIEACQNLFPTVNQIAVFDTAFHQTMPETAYLYALPTELHRRHGIRKYGFHGINHHYVLTEAQKLLKQKKTSAKRLITIHLGNGCSITAIKNGKSIENSMGYTPLEGLPMGTRSGDLDPALIQIISQKTGKNLAQTMDLLNKESGLLGLSGRSSDMRTVWAAAQHGDRPALLAIDIYSYRIAKYLNAYIGVLGGVDAIVFTAGIGENAWYIRSRVLSYTRHLGIRLESTKNSKNATFFQSRTSSTKLMIIPANEELEIARQSLTFLSKKK